LRGHTDFLPIWGSNAKRMIGPFFNIRAISIKACLISENCGSAKTEMTTSTQTVLSGILSASFRLNKEKYAKTYIFSVKWLPKIEEYFPVGLHNLVSEFERETGKRFGAELILEKPAYASYAQK
jgi:hypothetical protein